ncbi:Tyrosinase-like protein orsC [Paramyrothecium foliicola]|nr:Tyrosinase-like protein orsC [Paramyrothecium foliicola]
MHVTYAAAWAVQITLALSATIPQSISSYEKTLAELAQSALEKAQKATTSDNLQVRSNSCKWSDVRIRREWDSISVDERKDYIAAVQCLQSKPARTPSEAAPGAKTRFDDFVATHINQTMTIHYTANFLPWHRYFTWLYEEALREECGYKGTQPYWNWARTAQTGLEKSPIFDGSETSMSGNGEFVQSEGDIILGASSGLPPIYLPTGNGGGCVKSGPFKDMVVNLGPAALDSPGGVVVANPNGPLSHNPRCLSRDLTDKVNQDYANVTAIVDLITKTQNVADFQLQMQGAPGSGNIGVHGGGHYSLGGDPGRDVFTSPGDPAFYLHHAMIDRVWWIWQTLCPSQRMRGEAAISGTRTFFNQPPSPNATLEDLLDYGFAAGPPLQIKDALSTLAGPFCYVYL